jgi:hypothetical protein
VSHSLVLVTTLLDAGVEVIEMVVIVVSVGFVIGDNWTVAATVVAAGRRRGRSRS